jgi:hypothetical protein
MAHEWSERDLEQAIDRMFRSVWSGALGDAIRAPERAGHSPSRVDVLAAQIAVRGESDVDVRLYCPRESAREFAAAFFRKPVALVSEDELEATLLELVNILGGNLKSWLPGRNELKLPECAAELHANLNSPPCIGRELDFRGWPCRLAVTRA